MDAWEPPRTPTISNGGLGRMSHWDERDLWTTLLEQNAVVQHALDAQIQQLERERDALRALALRRLHKPQDIHAVNAARAGGATDGEDDRTRRIDNARAAAMCAHAAASASNVLNDATPFSFPVLSEKFVRSDVRQHIPSTSVHVKAERSYLTSPTSVVPIERKSRGRCLGSQLAEHVLLHPPLTREGELWACLNRWYPDCATRPFRCSRPHFSPLANRFLQEAVYEALCELSAGPNIPTDDDLIDVKRVQGTTPNTDVTATPSLDAHRGNILSVLTTSLDVWDSISATVNLRTAYRQQRWPLTAPAITTYNPVDCMLHYFNSVCVLNGPWSAEEDERLLSGFECVWGHTPQLQRPRKTGYEQTRSAAKIADLLFGPDGASSAAAASSPRAIKDPSSAKPHGNRSWPCLNRSPMQCLRRFLYLSRILSRVGRRGTGGEECGSDATGNSAPLAASSSSSPRFHQAKDAQRLQEHEEHGPGTLLNQHIVTDGVHMHVLTEILREEEEGEAARDHSSTRWRCRNQCYRDAILRHPHSHYASLTKRLNAILQTSYMTSRVAEAVESIKARELHDADPYAFLFYKALRYCLSVAFMRGGRVVNDFLAETEEKLLPLLRSPSAQPLASLLRVQVGVATREWHADEDDMLLDCRTLVKRYPDWVRHAARRLNRSTHDCKLRYNQLMHDRRHAVMAASLSRKSLPKIQSSMWLSGPSPHVPCFTLFGGNSDVHNDRGKRTRRPDEDDRSFLDDLYDDDEEEEEEEERAPEDGEEKETDECRVAIDGMPHEWTDDDGWPLLEDGDVTLVNDLS